jgi:hypothetical protein
MLNYRADSSNVFHHSPDWSNCLSSFFIFRLRRLRRRNRKIKNSECGKPEKLLIRFEG